MKLYNKIRKLEHIKKQKERESKSKIVQPCTNLFDEIYTHQTENLKNSNGLIMATWQYTKL